MVRSIMLENVHDSRSSVTQRPRLRKQACIPVREYPGEGQVRDARISPESIVLVLAVCRIENGAEYGRKSCAVILIFIAPCTVALFHVCKR